MLLRSCYTLKYPSGGVTRSQLTNDLKFVPRYNAVIMINLVRSFYPDFLSTVSPVYGRYR
jgi:hypothetical protein